MKTTTRTFNRGYLRTIMKPALQLLLCIIVYASFYSNVQAQTCASNSPYPYEWPSQRNWFFAHNLFSGVIVNMSTGAGTTVGNAGNPINGYEGNSAVSDDYGNLLFFTNGRKLWKADATLVSATAFREGDENGTGKGSAAQGCLIVKHPLNYTDYHVFTTDDALSSTFGFNYTVVDKTPTVTGATTRLGAYRSMESVCATKHSNGIDIWISVREGTSGNKGARMYSYLLTCTGLNTTPVVSTVPTMSWGGTDPNEERRGMAFSHDGTKLAVGDGSGVLLLNFNNTTGAFSNPQMINPSIGLGAAYDLTFSPNDDRLFVSGQSTQIYRFDVTSGVGATIAGTQAATGLATQFSSIEIGPGGVLYYVTGSAGSGTLYKVTGNLDTGTSYSSSAVASTNSTCSLSIPNIFVPPNEDVKITPAGPFTACDAAVDLSTNFVCKGTTAEDGSNYYTGTGITNAATGAFNPATATIGSNRIIFQRCDARDTIFITVNTCGCTNPTINTQPTAQTKCVGATATFTVAATGSSLTYQWQVDKGSGFANVVVGDGSGGTTNSFTTVATTAAMNGYDYRVIISSGTCNVTSNAVNLTVNLLPTVTATGTTTICSGTAPSIALTSNVAGATFAWPAPTVTGGITGASAGSGTPIAQTLTNPGTTAGTVTYVVTATANGCSGTPQNVVITVNPTPNVTATGTTTICSGTAPSIALTSNVAGATFAWPAPTVTGGITGASAGSGTPIAQTLTNPGTTAGTVTYVVTPTANSCSGTAQNVVITVNPKPNVTATGTTTICSGTAPSIALTSNVAGATFAWPAPTVTGGITGASAGSGTPIAQTLTNPGTTAGTVTYVVTPTANSCSGTAQNVVITVNPTPNVTATGTTTICSGTAPSIALTSNVAGATFAWPAPTVTGGITGASAGSGTPIAQTLTNPGATAGTVTYVVTPTANGCSGTAQNVIITVNPTPNVTATGSTTICSGTAPSIALTSNVAGATFAWPAPTVTGGITGASASSGATIAQTLTNPGTTAGTVTYVVTPTANSCTGTAQNVVITVNPIPNVTATGTTTICSGTAPSIALTSNVAGATFAWPAPTITGIITGASLGSGTPIAQTLTNSGTTAGTVTYSVTPTANSCSGTAQNVVITVNPAVTITTQPAASTVCSGGNTSFTVVATGAVSYQWYGVTHGMLSNGAKYSGVTTASLSITGATASEVDDYYVIISGAAPCGPKTSTNATLTINSVTTINSFAANATTLCEGDALTLTGAVGGTAPFNYTLKLGGVTVDTKLSQASSTYTYSVASVVAGTHNGTYTLDVTSACSGNPNSSVIIAVNKVIISSNPTAQAVCSGTAATFTVGTTGSIGALTYQWYKGPIPGTPLANGGNISGATTATLTVGNASASDVDVYYVEVKAGGACAKNSVPVSLSLTAGSTITTQPSITSKCVGDAATMTVVESPTGTAYQWYKNTDATPVADGGTISGATSATLNISAVTLGDAGTYYVKITTTCGVLTTDKTAVLTVNGVTISAQPTDQGTCNNGNVTFDVTASGPGLTYQWQENTGSGFTNIPSATGPSLNLNPVLTAMDGYTYRVNILSNGLCPVTSNVVNLGVTSNTVINTQPIGGNYCQGDPMDLIVAGSGTGAPTYQWYLNNVPIPSGTNDIYHVASIAAADAGSYKVDVTTSCGTVTSNVVVVKVNNVTINTQPTPQTVCEGGSATYTVAATGLGTLSYQWQVGNGVTFADITGQTSSSYTLTTSMTDDNTIYRVVIEDDNACAVNSNAVTLDVNAKTVITTQPTSTSACEGSPFSLSVVATTEGAATYTWIPDTRSVGSNSTYSVGSALPSDAGSYKVTIGNAGLCPAVTSNTVTVTVTPTPSNSLPVTVPDICLNSAGTITVANSENNVTYQIYDGTGTTAIGTPVAGSNGSTITLAIPNSEINTPGTHPFVVKADPGAGCPLVTLINPGDINVIGAPGAVTGPDKVCTNANTGLVYSVTDNPLNNPVTYNWTVIGGTINPSTVTGTNTFIVDLNTTGASGTIELVSVSTTTATGVTCPVNDKKNVTQVIAYQPEGITISEDTICAGNTVTVTITNANATGYNWYTGPGVQDESVNSNTPKTFSFNTPGDIAIKFKPFHPCLTSSTAPIIDTVIHVIAPPVANAGSDIHLDNLVPFNLDGSGSSTGNIYRYQWTSTDPGAMIQGATSINAISLPTELNSTYTLTVSTTNNASCSTSDDVDVTITPSVKIPNVFSPNKDNIHDVLIIQNIQFFPKAVLYVYNQWGELIYKSQAGYPEPWDGTRDGKECAVSAYYYVLELNQSGYKSLAGDVTIIK